MSGTPKFSLKRKNLGIWMLPVLLLAMLWACSGEEADGSTDDPEFCKCIKVTDKLNKFSADLLERQANAFDAKKMKKLRNDRDKACKRYYQMSGDEMKKRQKGCKK